MARIGRWNHSIEASMWDDASRPSLSSRRRIQELDWVSAAVFAGLIVSHGPIIRMSKMIEKY